MEPVSYTHLDVYKRQPVHFVCFTQYDATMPNVDVAFKPQSLVNTFGEYISKKGLTQLRIAETEKYAHVTFFFNGGVEKEFENEDRALIKSPAVATYDMKPEKMCIRDRNPPDLNHLLRSGRIVLGLFSYPPNLSLIHILLILLS